MKSLVVFYSYTGHTKRLAQELAAKEAADITEVRDIRRPGKLKAYSLGCFAAMRGKPWPIQPLHVDWAAYDRLILCAPVWAGNPPPAFYALLERLPRGKAVSVKMVSGGGQSQCKARLEGSIKGKGCTLESFEDIRMN
jgi:multimeric flavodoxin WrbA